MLHYLLFIYFIILGLQPFIQATLSNTSVLSTEVSALMSARTVIGNSPNPIHFDCTLPVNTTMWLATTTTAAAAALSESPSVNLMNWDWKTEMVGKYEH